MLQVHLDTVEVILSLRDGPQSHGASSEAAGLSSGPSSSGAKSTLPTVLTKSQTRHSPYGIQARHGIRECKRKLELQACCLQTQQKRFKDLVFH